MGLLRMAARTAVVAGTATAVSGSVQHKQQQKYANQEQQAAAQQQAAAAPAAPAGPSADEQLLEIQKLGALKDQGLLTEEEFTAKKAQILGI
jgi:hypothetical protein